MKPKPKVGDLWKYANRSYLLITSGPDNLDKFGVYWLGYNAYTTTMYGFDFRSKAWQRISG